MTTPAIESRKESRREETEEGEEEDGYQTQSYVTSFSETNRGGDHI